MRCIRRSAHTSFNYRFLCRNVDWCESVHIAWPETGRRTKRRSWLAIYKNTDMKVQLRWNSIHINLFHLLCLSVAPESHYTSIVWHNECASTNIRALTFYLNCHFLVACDHMRKIRRMRFLCSTKILIIVEQRYLHIILLWKSSPVPSDIWHSATFVFVPGFHCMHSAQQTQRVFYASSHSSSHESRKKPP